ncbi:branched-chain amino acid transport system ATP-binding protein [Microbacterium sp. SORGH_AS 862]|nr:branched-chain amino acid transport system ATP-binding protein [Microbacterium sp. SORGH_AS_0862]
MTNATEPVLVAKDLHAGYLPGVNILNGVNIVAHPGELIGIIGPNGAGKSTFLKAVFGQVSIRGGSVTLKGTDITGWKPNKLVSTGVGFVPQTNNVFPSLTIEENLQMGIYQKPRKFREQLDKIFEIFPVLADRRDQRAGSLSGGERQSVAMARALMMDPSVLLLDEPSAGLSPVRQDETFIRTRRINKAGVSVIMASSRTRDAACRSATARTCSTRDATPTRARDASSRTTRRSSSSTSARSQPTWMPTSPPHPPQHPPRPNRLPPARWPRTSRFRRP